MINILTKKMRSLWLGGTITAAFTLFQTVYRLHQFLLSYAIPLNRRKKLEWSSLTLSKFIAKKWEVLTDATKMSAIIASQLKAKNGGGPYLHGFLIWSCKTVGCYIGKTKLLQTHHLTCWLSEEKLCWLILRSMRSQRQAEVLEVEFSPPASVSASMCA